MMKKNIIRLINLTIQLFFLTIFLVSCSFHFGNIAESQITDIEDELTYYKISRKAFMGGSVLYNPDNPLIGQLANGVKIGVRLGHVKKNDVSDNECIFTDSEEDAIYGYIKINLINENEIYFTYFNYSSDGLDKFQQSFTMKQGECIDINSDGFFDLKYSYPLYKRPSFENALCLTFLSNKDTQNTSMFAVLPEQYFRGVYPSGIMGINPDGKFIINKYEVNSVNRAVVQGVVYGDYVLDSQTGEYQKVVSNTSNRNARFVDDSELETVVETEHCNYYFCPDEFNDYLTLDNLLFVLPKSIIESIDESVPDIDKLNYILESRNLLKEIALENDLPIDEPEVIELLSSLDVETQDYVVKFNRYLLESLYPEKCPKVDIGNNDITSIFPLLSVIISNPENNNDSEYAEIQRSATTLGTANSYRDYIEQKEKIDKLYDGFYPIGKFSYDFPGWNNFIKEIKAAKQKETDNSKSKDDDKIDFIGETGTLDDILTILKTKPKTNIPGTITNGAILKLGVRGHFKISFSNVEGGIYAGVYISGDTSLDMKKILAEYPVKDIPKLSSSKETLLNIDLKLFDAPPINIGVVTLKFSLSGGINIPAYITITGNITTSFYAGFTGFYAVGIDMGANYGISTTSIKLWRIRITIPTGIYFCPYSKGTVINETASFVGPTSEITPLKLQSGCMELCISPYIYVEPGITIANCLYGGLKIGPALDIGCGLKFNVDDLHELPTSIELYGILGGGLELRAVYGLDVGVKKTIFRIATKGEVELETQLRKKKTNYPLWKINF